MLFGRREKRGYLLRESYFESVEAPQVPVEPEGSFVSVSVGTDIVKEYIMHAVKPRSDAANLTLYVLSLLNS